MLTGYAILYSTYEFKVKKWLNFVCGTTELSYRDEYICSGPIMQWSNNAVLVCLYMCHAVYIFFISCFTAQVLKVCRTPGPTACSKTKILHLNV